MATNRFKVKKGLQTINESTGVSENVIPVGTIMMWTSQTPPEGWLVCDGSNQSRTTYSELSDFLNGQSPSYPFGNGNGSTTFTLPDLRSRTIIGVGAGPQYTRTLGQSSGTETHTVESANLATHTHNIPVHTHAVTVGSIGTMNVDSGSHTHNYQMTTGAPSAQHTHNHGAHGHSWYSVTELANGTNMPRNQTGGGSVANLGVEAGATSPRNGW